MTRRGLFARLVAVLAAAVGVRKVVNWHPEVVASDPQVGISIRFLKYWPGDDKPSQANSRGLTWRVSTGDRW